MRKLRKVGFLLMALGVSFLCWGTLAVFGQRPLQAGALVLVGVCWFILGRGLADLD